MLTKVLSRILSPVEELVISRPFGPSTPNVDFANSTFSITPRTFAADGIESASVDAHFEDANGNPLEGKTGDLVKGFIQIGADICYVTPSATVVDADGIAEVTLYIQVYRTSDAPEGVAVPNFPASFITVSSTGTGNTITQPTGVTDSLGGTTATFKTTVAELKTISVSIGDLVLNDQPVIDAGGTITPTDPGDYFFKETFAGLAFNNDNGFTWGGSTSATIVNQAGKDCLRYRFGPDASGEDSRAEQRFNLGRNLEELWIEYEAFYPTNYVHRNESPSNNKFIRIWGDDYNYQNKVGASTWYNVGDTRGAIRIDRNVTVSSGIGPGTNGGTVDGSPTELCPIPLGEWCTIRIYTKMCSSTAANDGVFRVYVNGVVWIEWTNLNQYRDTTTPYWNTGYFLGAANSGFLEETDILQAAHTFWETDPQWENNVATFTDISRDASSEDGGDTVLLTVSGIAGTPVVTFDDVPATDVTIVNSTTISCTVPAGTVGIVDAICGTKTLTNPRAAKIGGAFEYLPAPTTTFVDRNFDDGVLGTGLVANVVSNGGAVTVTTDESYSGTHSVKCTGALGDTGNASFRNSTNIDVASEANGVYARYYYLMPLDTVAAVQETSDQIKTFLFRRQAGDGQPGWIMTGIGSAFPDGVDQETFVSFIDNGILNINGTPNEGRSGLGGGVWREFIYWQKWESGISEGRCKLWIDGQLQFDVTDAALGSANTDYRLQLGIAHQENPSADVEVFVDDVFVANGFPTVVVP